MAAEALAHVLISHGTCRVAWAQKGSFLSLLDLMRYAGVLAACKIKEISPTGGHFHQNHTLDIAVWQKLVVSRVWLREDHVRTPVWTGRG